MDPERWRRINDIFQASVARPAEERQAFLADACAGDIQLWHDVERLVRAHERAAGFLKAPAAAEAVRLLALDQPSAVADQFGSYKPGSQFRGTDRYTVLRRLGAGGMGVVYEVHDRTRDEVIALKTLLHVSAADILRLKREFRSLADIAHANVVCLYDLIVEGEDCFFTMELVKGVNFVYYVWDAAGPDASPTAPSRPALDADRLRSVLRQLVEGLSTLHRRGKLHRDIKPSNVLVTDEGRVVILDFGLMSDVLAHAVAAGEQMAGTPAYLAPEQHRGAPPSEATDWYSVGVTLYEALTGRLPFDGPTHELRRSKWKSDPPPPVTLAPDVPADLNAICTGLMCRDPERRWSGHDALRSLDGGRAASQPAARPEPRRGESPFVGRQRELAILERAFETATDGSAATVYIHGPSGIGKSALVQRFLDGVLERDDAVVLRGRCYEHESVPFKALDGVVDSLSQYLASLDRSEADALVPEEARALARLFPVMLQVHAVATAPRPAAGILDPLALRRLAFSALRELLTRIAERHPLVLYIDDLHWADADSTVLLEDLFRSPDPPPLLTIACFRHEEIASKPFLQGLLSRAGSDGRIALPIEPMTDEEAREVIASLMSPDRAVSHAERVEMAREGGGNPFLLEQLARYVAAGESGSDREATFAGMLDRRMRGLPDGVRRFLEILAVCGRPMAPEVVYEASGLLGNERPLMALLRADHLLRSSGSAERIEMYHDRIREALAARLSPDETRGIHRLLVQTLVARRADDPEALFEHYRGAGDGEGASAQAAIAARKANAALAFDRAAVFYRHALELAPGSAAVLEWKEELGQALENAGRPRDAAEVYLDSARSADHTRRVELQRRAAEQFLVGGHIDRGLDVIGTVLRAVRMRLASGPRTALASLLWRRARLRWRGLGFTERDSARVPAETLLRIDTAWSVTTGLFFVDSVRAADFNTRHLRLALEAGEPYRIARALALEAAFVVGGDSSRLPAAECAEQANRMAERVGQPHALALSALTAGIAAFALGEWKKTTLLCERAVGILRDQCAGATWELNCAYSFLLYSLLFQGELRDVSRRLPPLLVAAQDRGNLYFETELRTRMHIVRLAADEFVESERQANEAMERWSHHGFHRQHYTHVLVRIETALYRGDANAAWQLFADNWTAIKGTLLLRVPFLRIEASHLRARAALLMAATGRDTRRFLSIAANDAQTVAQGKMAWSDAMALLLEAAVAHGEGHPTVAEGRLAEAADAFDRADMKVHAACARRRLGALLGNDRGRALLRQADEWMSAQTIKNPARMTRLLAPGFPDPPESVVSL